MTQIFKWPMRIYFEARKESEDRIMIKNGQEMTNFDYMKSFRNNL